MVVDDQTVNFLLDFLKSLSLSVPLVTYDQNGVDSENSQTRIREKPFQEAPNENEYENTHHDSYSPTVSCLLAHLQLLARNAPKSKTLARS